jgi:hypothetical protein
LPRVVEIKDRTSLPGLYYLSLFAVFGLGREVIRGLSEEATSAGPPGFGEVFMPVSVKIFEKLMCCNNVVVVDWGLSNQSFFVSFCPVSGMLRLDARRFGGGSDYGYSKRMSAGFAGDAYHQNPGFFPQ